MSKKKSHYSKAGLVFEELEPRLLLSADPLAVATDVNVAAVQELVLGDNGDQTAIVQVHVEQSFSSARNELVIIDSRAPNYQQLHNDLIKAQQQGRNIHVVVLDAHRDGIEQINEALARHNKIDAVHIVSHGNDGQLQLGATQINKTTLRDRSTDISSWKDTFSDDGDLLIYGCNLAETADGKSLVDALSHLTATDVAASDDLTGNQLLGGDWELEYSAGDIESDIAFSDDLQQHWQGTLDVAAQAAAEEQKADAEEQQQQEQQAQLEQTEQQAAVVEEEHAASKQNEEEQQAAIAEEQRQEVVFIDESVNDFQSFIDDLQNNSGEQTTFELVVLDGENDGIEQINEILSAYYEVDALHIISHGDDGAVKLGNTWLNASNLEQYSESLTAWGSSLGQDADILIYGCNLAESTNGEQFVEELASFTGADVAASDDITGHNSLNGDWVLEYSSGSIESSVAISAELQNSYEAVLAPPVANNDSYSVIQDQTLIVNAMTDNATSVDLAAAWQFEEGSGTTTTDTTGNGNDGTLNGGTAWTTSSRTGDGALVFDGVDDYVQTTGSSLDLSTAMNFTLSAWFKTDTTSGQQHMLWQGVSTENGWGTPGVDSPLSSEMHLTVGRHDINDKITFFMGYNDANPASIDITSASNFTDTTGWHQAVVVVSDLGGGTLQADLYVDGVLEGSDTGTQIDRSQWDSDLRIGRGGGASRYYDGMMDQVGIYDRALTPTEATNLYQTGVIANDTDIDGDILSASVIAGPVSGSLALNSDGSFTYTPNAGFVGIDTFTYKVNDGSLDSNTATVTIDVISNAPVAVDDTPTVIEDTATIIDLVGNDTDPEGDTLTVLDITTPANGAVVNNGDGTVTYTPNTNYNGSDTFDYVVTDSNDGRTHYWNLDGDADDAIGGNHGTLNGGPTTVAGQFGNGLSFDEVDDHVVIPDVTYGDEFTLSFQFKIDDNSGTNYQYLYSHGAFGSQNSLNVLIGESGAVGADANQLIVRFLDANDPAGGLSLGWDISGIVGDGLWHTYTMSVETGVGTTFYLDGAVHTTHPNGGDAFNPTGDVYLGAREDLNTNRFYGGLLDSVQIHDRTLNAAEIIDLHTAGTSVATVNITVTPVNDAPLATNLSAAESYTEDTALNLTDIVVSDVDSANVTVTLTLSDVAAGTLNTATSGAVTSTFSGGVWTASGAIADVNTLLAGVTFTPSLNYDSNFSITTSVDDGVAPAITGSKAMTATAVNDVPVAAANTVTTTEDNAYNFTAADFTFIDVEGDSIVSATIINQSLSGGTLTHSGGTIVNNGDTLTAAQLDTLVYTPTANTTGSPLATFDFSVNDAGVGVVIAQMRIDVIAVNDVPVATANTVTTTEDNAYNFAASDFTFTDTEGDALVSATISSLSLAGGTLTHSGGTAVNGGDTLTAAQLDTLIYTPASNANGTPLATFDSTVNDAGAGTVVAQMDINVTAVNDVPVATVNTVTTTEDNAYSFSSADFTFSDAEGDALVSARITNLSLAGGTLTYSGGIAVSDGDTLAAAQLDTLIYTPVANANGTPLATFDFTVNDAGAGVVTAQMDIDVTAVNDVPVATANTVTTTEDNAYNFAAGDFTFTDTEGNALVSATVTNLSLAGGTLTHSGGLTVNNGNTLTAAQLDTLTYTPASNANGTPLATFDFTVNDAGAGTVVAQMDIDVTAVNDVPVATVNTVTTTEDNAYSFSSADFTFSDVEGNVLVSARITNLSLAGGTLTYSGGIAVSDGDTLAAAQLDTLIYTPATNANGTPLATFDFTVNDVGAGVVTAQMDIDVTAVNDVPVATANTVTTTEDNAYNFAAGDFTYADTEADALVSSTITNLSLAGGTLRHSGGITVNNGDTLTAAQLNTLVYTPTANTTGSPLATFDFTVNDAGAGTVVAQMGIDVTVVNDVPLATANTVTTIEDNAYNFAASDFTFTDTEGDALVSATITNLALAGGTLTHSGGTVVNNGDTLTAVQLDTLIYSPAANANGLPLATFDFTVNDAGAGVVTAQMDIDVTAVNDAPVATADSFTIIEGSTTVLDLALNDTDVDDGLDLNSIVITGAPVNGTLVINGNGTVTYTHNGSETLSDSFGYTISDISGSVSNTASVNITVTPVNDAPVAVDDSATVAEGNSILIDLAANDTDVDNVLDLNGINIIGTPANGSLIINGDGTVTYTHDGSNTASDSFTYTILDVSGGISNTATVNIMVTSVNDAPTTSGIADVTVNEDSVATSIDLNAAFDDVDNLDAELTYSIVGNNNIGLFTGVGADGSTGQLTLDYAADMNGSAQISIRATDPSGLSVDTLFTVTVNPVNDNPVLQANTGMLATGTTPATISSGELNVTDIDNLDTELVYSITILPSNGELLLNGIVLAMNDTFTQAELDSNLVVYRIIGTGAADQFGFTVSDTAGGTLVNNTFDIVVQLSPDNDDDAPENETPPNDDTNDGETSQEEITETDTGGSTEGAGGYGGGFEPLGSSSIPPAAAPVLSIDPSPAPVQEQIQPVEKEDHIVSEINEYNVATFTASQLKSVDALWTAIDKMKQEMGDAANNKANAVQIKIAAAETTGVVLTAGVVAWILRSGALLSSLMSTIPLWKGYDPLPILAYKDDEEEEQEEIHEDRIPTSLEELKKLKKLIKQKEKLAEKADIEILFGNSATRE